MPATTFPAELPPSKSSPGQEVRFEILESEFGDGYVQRTAAGINTKRTTWSLSWDDIDNDDAATIINFLDATEGYIPFYWTAPGDSASRLWIMDGPYSISNINSLSKSVTTKFKRWFGATPL